MNPLIFSIVSPKIARVLRDDPTCKSFEMPPIGGPIDDFIGLVYGRPMDVTATNCRFVYRMADVLEITKIKEACEPIVRKTSTSRNLLRFAEELISVGADCSDEIDQIAANIRELQSSVRINKWDVRILEKVLGSSYLSIPVKEFVKDVILPLVDEDKEKYSCLVKCINFKLLSDKERKEIIDKYIVDLNDIRGFATQVLLCRRSRASYLE